MSTETQTINTEAINELVAICHGNAVAAGWHTDIATGKLYDRNKGEMLCLIHSEISEAMEGKARSEINPRKRRE